MWLINSKKQRNKLESDFYELEMAGVMQRNINSATYHLANRRSVNEG
jgi:hypothetical protein